MRNIFKRTKTVELTVPELALTAADMLADDVEDLRFAAASVELSLWKAVEELSEINDELAEKSALCGAMMAQLRDTNESICAQTEENAILRDRITALLQPEHVCTCGGDACSVHNAE